MSDYTKITNYEAKDLLLHLDPAKAIKGTEVDAEFNAIATMSATKGDKSGTLAQFAATTSLELKGVISDETGSGALVFATSPTLVTPALGTPASGTLTNCTGLPLAGVVDSTTEALGVGSLEVGHATDTTITRTGAGAIAVEGVAVLLSGGALGTPSSGTVTNLTGTASININGTVGATTPAAGAFTTLSATGVVSATSTIGVGGATPAASGAGITFPATQSASSDANTLDDYEEGTWTPDQGSGLTLVGAFSSYGKYTKIGRLVTVSGMVIGATTVALAGGGQLCSNLPFSQAATEDPYGVAVLTSSGNPAGSAFVLSLQITGSVAQPAVSNIKFTVTYFV